MPDVPEPETTKLPWLNEILSLILRARLPSMAGQPLTIFETPCKAFIQSAQGFCNKNHSYKAFTQTYLSSILIIL